MKKWNIKIITSNNHCPFFDNSECTHPLRHLDNILDNTYNICNHEQCPLKIEAKFDTARDIYIEPE